MPKPMKPFRIFRPGKHTASCGTQIEFTEDDLKRAVAAYSPSIYAAPLVIGHPKQEDRAYGWTESLSYSDGHVVAHPEHVEPQFSDLVESKAFRNRSASWYMPDHPNNPVPGVLYPKHIGFLGAVPPSLKSLGDVQFNESSRPVDFSADPRPDLVLEFADITSDDRLSMASVMSTTARTLRNLKNYLIADKGQEEADRVIPEWEIEDPLRQAMRMEEQARQQSKTETPSYTESTTTPEATMTPEEIKKLQDEAAAANARVKAFEEREAALARSERVAQFTAELQPLVQQGRVLPRMVPALAQFMAGLDADAQVVEFGEAPAGGTAPTVSPAAFMSAFLKELPVAVDFKERGNTSAAAAGTMSQAAYNVAVSARVDKAKAEGRTMSFAEASRLVLEETGATVQVNDQAPNV